MASSENGIVVLFLPEFGRGSHLVSLVVFTVPSFMSCIVPVERFPHLSKTACLPQSSARILLISPILLIISLIYSCKSFQYYFCLEMEIGKACGSSESVLQQDFFRNSTVHEDRWSVDAETLAEQSLALRP